MKVSRRILPIIVIAQFFCTSLWFAGNAIMPDLINAFNLKPTALGSLTSAVQLGFISGTLTFAILSVADRFSPSKVFFTCAILGAGSNLFLLWDSNQIISLVIFRFSVGFFLAGIYPVGMKIASDYYQKGLGKSLGFLVGALVLGTAFPHALRMLTQNLNWKWVIYLTSALAVVGGISMLIGVKDGPFRSKVLKTDLSAFFKVFKKSKFRQAAFGYFGHMWELYAFWAFIPFIIKAYQQFHKVDVSVALYSFFIIGIGSIACIIGGYISENYGSKRTATFILFCSGCCCVLSPLIFLYTPLFFFIAFLLFWGMVVIADSPLFSTLVAQNAPIELKGTALTIVNSLGFAITIFSIQLLSYLSISIQPYLLFLILALGPILGLISLKKA